VENNSNPRAVSETANRSHDTNPEARTTGEAASHMPSQERYRPPRESRPMKV